MLILLFKKGRERESSAWLGLHPEGKLEALKENSNVHSETGQGAGFVTHTLERKKQQPKASASI